MTWFKVDDGWYAHPKVLGLDSNARALWVSAGSWAAQQATDGLVPEAALPLFAHLRNSHLRNAIADLVDAGLWDEEMGGWRFHDWDRYQPTRDEVEERRTRMRGGGLVGNCRRWHPQPCDLPGCDPARKVMDEA